MSGNNILKPSSSTTQTIKHIPWWGWLLIIIAFIIFGIPLLVYSSGSASVSSKNVSGYKRRTGENHSVENYCCGCCGGRGCCGGCGNAVVTNEEGEYYCGCGGGGADVTRSTKRRRKYNNYNY